MYDVILVLFVAIRSLIKSSPIWAVPVLILLLLRVGYFVSDINPLFERGSFETSIVLTILGIFVASCVYNLIRRAITGDAYSSLQNELYALPVFVASIAVFGVWLWNKPGPKAHYWPLLTLVAFSGWAAWHHRHGALGRWRHMLTSGSEARSIAWSSDADADTLDVATVLRPSENFASIAGMQDIKARIKDAAGAIIASRKKGAQPRNGILLHGAPGNGKTVFAHALAGELKLPMVTFSQADVESKWVGEKSARVRQAFARAVRAQPCVLFIDEIDSFLESRDTLQAPGGGVKENRDLVNALLTLLVEIRQHRIILMAATNYMDRLDSAAVREGRFDFKIEITPPDKPARVGLLRQGLLQNVPTIAVEDSVIDMVAQRWNGFSVKRILAVTEELRPYTAAKELRAIGFKDFMGALRQLQGQRGAAPENVKKLSQLLLAPQTRESIDLISGRMADPEHTERLGGTVPTGVLFSGPPGTGKTATCKALAAELGWAFLPATGADLAREPKRLEALHKKAQDLRPAIIFIDEADELLRSREFSANTDATNKLLTLMDGVGDRVRDVVWVAATNSPEQVDAALLRGGRFTEKVRFELPTEDVVGEFIEGWLTDRKIILADDVTSVHIAQQIGNQSIANVEAILQAALNRAIARRTTPVQVGRADIEQARRSVGVE